MILPSPGMDRRITTSRCSHRCPGSFSSDGGLDGASVFANTQVSDLAEELYAV